MNCFLVCLHQPGVATKLSHDGDRLRSRDGEVIQIPASTLYAAIDGDAIGTMALPQELATLRIKSLAQGFESLGSNLALEAK